MNANFAAVVNCANGIASPFANAQSALASLPVAVGNVIVNSATLPPATYASSPTACIFNDGGSQIPITATGGGCWVLTPQLVYDIRWWGLSIPNQFYVSSTGNDYGGANFCVVAALPCATLGQAYISLKLFNMMGQSDTVNMTAGTFQGISMADTPPGSARGPAYFGTLGPTIVFNGVGATTIITDSTNNQLGVMLTDGRVSATFQNLEISVPSGSDGIFAAGIGNFDVIGANFTCFGQVGAIACFHGEGPNRIIVSVNGALTVAGTMKAVYALTFGSQGQLNPNSTVTCASGLTIDTAFITMQQNSTGLFSGSFSGSCNTVSTRNFNAGGNSYIDDAAITWPTQMANGVMQGGARHALPDVPCVGGQAGCGNTTAITGFGATPTVALSANSGLRSGQVNITAGGAGVAATGQIWLAFPSYLQVSGTGQIGQCTASPGQINGGSGTAWATTATAIVVAESGGAAQTPPTGENIQITWATNSGANVVAGNIYSINWQCDGD